MVEVSIWSQLFGLAAVWLHTLGPLASLLILAWL